MFFSITYICCLNELPWSWSQCVCLTSSLVMFGWPWFSLASFHARVVICGCPLLRDWVCEFKVVLYQEILFLWYKAN